MEKFDESILDGKACKTIFKYSLKTNPIITILEIFVYKIQPEIIKSVISGCILYNKIFRIVIFG